MKREIEPRIVAWLEAKLRYNGLYQHACATKDARVIFRLAMEACVGIREQGGNNRGPLVELIQETLGGADGEAWCMALVQTCLAFAETRTGQKSPIFPSEHCLTVWRQTPPTQRVKTLPALGAIAIWRHGTSDAGHTGVTVDAVVHETFKTVEGNTESGHSTDGKVERDGGGVYFNTRSMRGAGKMKLVGFLKPF